MKNLWIARRHKTKTTQISYCSPNTIAKTAQQIQVSDSNENQTH